MKVTISQEALLDSLKIVSRAVSTQNTLPVLGNILIRAEGETLYFSATNLEISLSTSIEAKISEEGSITIPSKILTSYTSLLNKNEDISFSILDGTTLKVKSKSSTTKIKGIGADEFPQITEVQSEKKIVIPSKIYRQAMHEVAFSAQENSSRPILSGVLFETKDNELRIVATDSYRLSETTIKLETPTEDISCVIPVKSVLEADRLGTLDDKVTITVSKNQSMFSVGDAILISRLIEGQFPDYNQIIPKSHSSVVKVNREDLALAVRRVSIFAKENNQHMKLTIVSDGTLTIATDSTQIGEEKTTLPAQLEGNENMIALNADYVLDILGALSELENVHIELESKTAPAVFRKEEDKDFIHLIMPLKM